MVNGCPLAILEGFIPFTNSLHWPEKLIMATPPNPQTSERRVLAGKAATIGREVGVNSELEPEEPEPGGGFEFSRGGFSREETWNGIWILRMGSTWKNRWSEPWCKYKQTHSPQGLSLLSKGLSIGLFYGFSKKITYTMRRHNAHLSGLLVASSMHEMIACRDYRLD